jgi:DNA modification methylase
MQIDLTPIQAVAQRVEVIGRAVLVQADCRDVLPVLGKVDACVTDPPYGIGKDGQIRTTGGNGGRKAYDFLGWDAERPSAEVFKLLLAAAPQAVIWGGNYFADLLPATGKWLVWDKGQRINQSDGELAWTSRGGALRIKTLNRVELMTDGAEHPTQKPVRLIKWCIEQLEDEPGLILDPFMGSGTTGIACVREGRSFSGIEREESYFDIAQARIRHAEQSPGLPLGAKKRSAKDCVDLQLLPGMATSTQSQKVG